MSDGHAAEPTVIKISGRECIGCAVFAGIGGMAPPLVYTAIDLTYKNGKVPEPSYLVGLVIFFVIGAVVSFGFKETVLKRALFLGIGLPALVNGAISEATSSVAWNPPALIRSAFAQDSASSKLYIEPNKKLEPYTIRFYATNGYILGSRVILKTNQRDNTIPIPKGSTYFSIENDQFSTKNVELVNSSTGKISVGIRLTRTRWSGFKRSLGVRDVKPYESHVTLKPMR